MKITTKLRSFTIMELIMAMLISSVIIGIVFYVYLLFNRQFSSYREKANAIDEYLVLQKALQTDLERADAIRNPSENEIACTGLQDTKMVLYTFNNAYITRSCGEAQDTFHIRNNGYEATPIKETSLVESLVLKITVHNVPLRATYKKIYSACQLMKQQPAYE